MSADNETIDKFFPFSGEVVNFTEISVTLTTEVLVYLLVVTPYKDF